MDDAPLNAGVQAAPQRAVVVRSQLDAFLAPLLGWLDTRLDRRLAQTFAHVIAVLLQRRNREHGLLLGELGSYVLAPAHAPTGTKRLSNLLRSPKWATADLVRYLWQCAAG